MDKDNIKVFIGSDTRDPCIIENEEDLLNYSSDKIITCSIDILKNINYKECMRYNHLPYNKLTYGDYEGSIEYSIEDKCYYGKILDIRDLGIKDLISYESDTPEGLQEAFEEAVKDYVNE